MVDKYKKYEDSSTGLLKWLNSSEEEARKQQSEAIAADPKTLQTQLEETKARRQAAKLGGLGVVWFLSPDLFFTPLDIFLYLILSAKINFHALRRAVVMF